LKDKINLSDLYHKLEEMEKRLIVIEEKIDEGNKDNKQIHKKQNEQLQKL